MPLTNHENNVARRRVFISYTKADKRFAHRLAKNLRELGFPVWLDAWEMRIGGSIVEGIEEGIDQSAWMVTVLSPSALQSEWVLKELRTGLVREAREHKVFILPALYKDVELPGFLRDKFYADFRNGYARGFAPIKDRLLEEYRSRKTSSWLLIKRPAHVEAGLPPAAELSWRYPSAFGSPSWERDDHLEVPCRTKSEFLIKSMLARPGGGKSSIALMSAQKIAADSGMSGMWFGSSGRLLLRQTGDTITGDYDWHGVSLAGSILGKLEKGLIQFQWDWKLSSEKGSGVFWTDIPNVLYGGWWMDFEDVDLSAIIEKRTAPSNLWEFASIRGLEVMLGAD